MLRNLTLTLILTFTLTSAHAHTGRLASDSCHNSKKYGTHCHEADTEIDFISNEAGWYEVSEVIDGDTLDLTYGNGILRIRLFGVDTAESADNSKLKTDAKAALKAQGIEATDAAIDAKKEELLAQGTAAKEYVSVIAENNIYVMFDNTGEFPFIKQGKYGRYLAYVFYHDSSETRFLNIDLVVNGHAEVDYIDTPFRYRWVFVESDLEGMQDLFSTEELPVGIADAPSREFKAAIRWAALKRE